MTDTTSAAHRATLTERYFRRYHQDYRLTNRYTGVCLACGQGASAAIAAHAIADLWPKLTK